ncbi:MAG: efflux RND transporter permease subunit, partial [Planctomycetes bacterium]|nr:efflux RND transporter permease subunit [Planctomycetota bacterium]
MSLWHHLILTFVRNPVFANLAALGILVGGIAAVFDLPRETFPDTSVDYVLVTVPYPGANPEDVERGVCIKIEQAVEGLPGVREVVAFAKDDRGEVYIAFDPATVSTGELLRRVQDRVSAITSFPEETDKPVIAEVIFREPVINIGVHGSAPERTIKHVAEEIRRHLLANWTISQVQLSGVRDYEVSIRLKEETLKRYSLTLQQVIDAISQSSLDLPAGTVRAHHEEVNVRTVGQRYTAADFEGLTIIAHPDGTSVCLGQLAEVRDSFAETPIRGRINGEPGATVTVFKTGREDISRIADVVHRFVASARPDLPEGINLAIWGDSSRDVDSRLEMLVRNGAGGMGLVIVCVLLFMDLSTTLAVAVGIPVAFAGAVVAIRLTGNSINMISLLGLLMVTGIIVDDAIVIAESVRSRARRGLDPELAVVEGTELVASPVLMSSLTTIVAFVPLMYVSGVMGKLIYILPVVVISAIIASGVEAFFILPAHLREWTSGIVEASSGSWRAGFRRRLDDGIDRVIERVYQPALRWALNSRAVVAGAAFAVALVAAGLVWSGRTPFVLFPKIDSNVVIAAVRFPDGTPAKVSEAAIEHLERTAQGLNNDPALKPWAEGRLVQNVYSVVGEWTHLRYQHGSAFGEVTLELMPAEQRRVDMTKVIEHWRQSIGTIPDALTVDIVRQQLGPTEKPIEIRLLGDDLEELERAADDVAAKLAEYAGVSGIAKDLFPGKRELRVSLRPGSENLGITVADLATQLRQGLYGGEAVRLQRGPDEVKVMVSYDDQDRRSLGAIEELSIRTRDGAAVPFHDVAETQMVRGYSVITRQDHQRRVRVLADVDEHYANAERIVRDLGAGFLPELQSKYPDISYVFDGERKRINESMSSLLRASAVAGVVMLALLGAVLKSYAQPLIIMAAIPLGMVGAIFGHA